MTGNREERRKKEGEMGMEGGRGLEKERKVVVEIKISLMIRR